MLAKQFSVITINLTKQVFLIFFVLFSLSGVVSSDTAPSKLPPLGDHATVKELLQHIIALERGFEQETRAIAALNERIARLEEKYLAVKSGIERSTGIQTGLPANETALPATTPQAQPAQTAPQPMQPAQVTVTTDETGFDLEHDLLSPFISSDFETLAIGGLLAILLLLLALHVYRRKREKADRDFDEPGLLDTDDSIEKTQDSNNHRKISQKLAALKKASQGSDSEDETTIVIRQDEYKKTTGNSLNSAISDARAFIEKGQPELAVKLLESFLAKNKRSEIGWQMLFKILHDQQKKNEFRKQALRFKRLEQSPDTWAKIQAWGLALEPDEPLYMNEQEKKKRFFSD